MRSVAIALPMRLSHAALGQMVPRRTGTIRWANIHYRRHGITVTAVAPGFVHTEFHQRMNARTDNIPAFLWLSAETVVTDALRAAARGKAVTVPTLRYKVIVALTRLLPSRLVAAGALRGR